ncbi:MAG TPA: VWA domain-containing protein [Terriglobales bacterium]|nr:VWA domain-containing protein [Terriglobales bacterium]
MWKRALAVFSLCNLISPLLTAQTATKEPVPTIRTTAREVILDVIVRDKHHHAIADVRPEEIQVYEDGVKQKITAFRDVQGAEQLLTEQALAKSTAPAVSAGTTKGPSTALRELNFVSVVFAQIAPLNLEFAREAVLEFLKSGRLPNTYVTIYRLDRALQLIQPYTSDNAALVKAVGAAAKGVNTGSTVSPSVMAASAVETTVDANVANMTASPLVSPAQAAAAQSMILDPIPNIVMDPLWARNAASQDVSVTLGSALVAQAQIANGLRFADSLSNGMDSMDALRELVRVQSKLPGRKVVLYLADGLTLPMDRRDVVDSVIGYANQMEVAFYAVDTRGLSADDPMARSLADLQRAGAESSANAVSPRIGHMEDDDIQLSVSSDRHLAMEELADSTGGFAVTNTNEIALPMQRIMEDIRTHYEVAYTPSATNFDGRFRKIQVRIDRPHVTVQTRSGYFAVPDVNGEPLQPFEMAALHAINARPEPTDFPYQASLLRFRPKTSAVDYEMAFDVPISSLRVVTDPKTDKGQIRVSLVALIHKPDGEIVGKVSRDLVREVSTQDLAHVGNDHILYAEPIELPGGHYVIDTAATDELAEKSAVKRMSVFVNAGKDFGVSSLELVEKVQRLQGPPDHQDPFEIDAGRIVPSLAETMPAGTPINLYFVVYPEATSETPPVVTLEMYRDGRVIGRQTLGSAKRREDGSMPILLRIKPDPGQCDMIITAHQGTLSSQASLSVKITPSGSGNPN